MKINYTQHARELLAKQPTVTAKTLAIYIIKQGFDPKKSSSIASLLHLAERGEVEKSEVNEKSRMHFAFTATPMLGKVGRVNGRQAEIEEVTSEGVLMLQSIIGNMAASRHGYYEARCAGMTV